MVTRVPVSHIVAVWLCALGLALVVTHVRTQDHYQPDRTIEGLVLDGGTVTTTAPVSTAGRPVEKIPHKEIDQ